MAFHNALSLSCPVLHLFVGSLSRGLSLSTLLYSSPSLIRPPYLSRTCGHIIERWPLVSERSKYIDSSSRKKLMALLDRVVSVESVH